VPTATRADPGPAFHALAHPARRRMLHLTREGERTAGELARRCALSPPAASQHLKVLREAGLVTVRARGNERLYRASPDRVAELRSWLDGFWSERLDALRVAVEAEHGGVS
jgi:DNA-binding transcriptional ArsR family regulator